MSFVQCTNCNAKTKTITQVAFMAWQDVDRYAVEAWNRRTDPVRHGKWILSGVETHWECSACGSHAPDVIDEENGYQVVEWLSSYCPHCGADMWEVDHEID